MSGNTMWTLSDSGARQMMILHERITAHTAMRRMVDGMIRFDSADGHAGMMKVTGDSHRMYMAGKSKGFTARKTSAKKSTAKKLRVKKAAAKKTPAKKPMDHSKMKMPGMKM